MPPSEYYPEALADQSLRVVTSVLAVVPDAIVIGGWGTWKRFGLLKSHDIDLIVEPAGRAAIRPLCSDWSESTHVGGRTWRGRVEGVHIDLYVPFQSRLGQRLQLRIEKLLPYTETLGMWRVLTRPAHAVTKMAALLDRPDSLPGEKDRHELRALLTGAVTPADLVPILRSAAGGAPNTLGALAAEAIGYLQDLGLERAERARLRVWEGTLRRSFDPHADPPPRIRRRRD